MKAAAAKSEDDVMWTENDDASGVADLLGFDLGATETADRSGLRALINSAFTPHRRMPMLDVIFDRAARAMTTGLRQLMDENFDATLDDVSSTRFGDFQGSLAPPAMIAVGGAASLAGNFLLVCDGALLIAAVDALLGGRRGRAASAEGRGFTAIERAIAERVFASLFASLGDAFAPVAAGAFTLQRLETTPRFAAIAREASVCALAKFRVRFEGGSGRISAVFPYTALESVADRLASAFAAESHEAERQWSEGLARAVAASAIDLDAVIGERTMSLRELGAMTPGDTLVFREAHGSWATLRANGVPVSVGRAGRLNDFAAVKLGEGT